MKKILFLIILMMFIYSPVYGKEIPYEVHFADTGQSDCILIRGGTRNYLIDTGASYTIYRAISYFKSIGVESIDSLFITHFHDDHYGGLEKIVNNLKVSKVILPRFEQKDAYGILKFLKDRGTKFEFLTSNYEINYEKINIKVITPIRRNTGIENNNSTVLIGYIDGVKYDFLSDIEESREMELMSNIDLTNCDIVKIAHHGLDTSSSERFINYLNPKAAVITCNGKESPSKAVIKRLSYRGTSILRTDTQGNIVISKNVSAESGELNAVGIEIRTVKMLK